jgi:hypothetical protein
MVREPVVVDSEDLDLCEDLLEILADGSGIGVPGEELREECSETLERLRDARP